jgi:hypothetical protein
MQTRVISALLVVWLTACTSVPREPGAGRYISGDGPPGANANATGASQQNAAVTEDSRQKDAEPDAAILMRQSMLVGALIGGIPLFVCTLAPFCTPDAWLAGAATLVAGTFVGMVIGAGRIAASHKGTRSTNNPSVIDR